MNLLCSRFGFLARLFSCSADEIGNLANNLVAVYAEDLNKHLGNELVQFSVFAQMFKDEANPELNQEQFMYNLILQKGVESSFPNVEVLLRMYLVLMVTNCSAERSFF